jgi:hypothetical protein
VRPALDRAHLDRSLDLSSSQRATLRTWSATDQLGSSGTPEMRGSDARNSKHPTFAGQKCAPTPPVFRNTSGCA